MNFFQARVDRPVILAGPFAGTGDTIVRIDGTAVGQPLRIAIPAVIGSTGATDEGLPVVWARMRIAELADESSYRLDPGMQVVHETGHVIVVRITRGEVTKVALHPLIISRIDVAENRILVGWSKDAVVEFLRVAKTRDSALICFSRHRNRKTAPSSLRFMFKSIKAGSVAKDFERAEPFRDLSRAIFADAS